MAVFGESYRRDMRDVPGFIAPAGAPQLRLGLSGSPTLFIVYAKVRSSCRR
jgi:hypothetical protein